MFPSSANTTDPLERTARRRARAKLGWFAHATVYVLVNALLLTLSLTSGRHWALYPLLGWGLGLALHGIAVWALAPGNALMERMVARERAHLQGR
jgi:predicted membrane channel-forming protein YqfA (hemolysin III family)